MNTLPPGQQLAAPGKWPIIGERTPAQWSDPWTLSISGLVESGRSWTLEEIMQRPAVERSIDLHCVTRWSQLSVPFRGIRLLSLLDECKLEPNARFISFVAHSERSHSTSLRLSDIQQLDPLIAWEASGVPITSEHGGPLRLIVPGRYLYKSLKWLTRIEVLADDRLGFWESTAGYHNHGDPWLEQRYIAANLSKAEMQRLLRSRNLSECDLRSFAAADQSLDGLVARDAILRDADFRGASLQQACFDGANLSNAHFRRANLKQASFLCSDLEGADFTGADLRGVNFSGAALTAVTFTAEDPTSAAIVDSSTVFTSLEGLMPTQHRFISSRLQS